MAVSLRFLGQAASKQTLLPAAAAVTPRVLGGMTPKTPMTPGAMSPTSFFVGRDAPSPCARSPCSLRPAFFQQSPEPAGPAQFHLFSSNSAASASGLRFGAQAASGFPTMLGRLSACAEAGAQRQSRPSDAGEAGLPQPAAAAQAAYLARRHRLQEREASLRGSPEAPLEAGGFPMLLGKAQGNPQPERTVESALATQEVTDVAAAVTASEPQFPMLLGSARATRQQDRAAAWATAEVIDEESSEREAIAEQPSARDQAALARERFLARRRVTESRKGGDFII